MYNRYMNSDGFEEFFKPIAENESTASSTSAAADDTVVSAAEPAAPESKPKGLSALKNLLGGGNSSGSSSGGLKLPELDGDMLLLLVLVYFLVADGNENISDTLIVIGALLLLGF